MLRVVAGAGSYEDSLVDMDGGCWMLPGVCTGRCGVECVGLVAVREDAVLCCTWVSTSIVYIIVTVVLP